MRDSMPASTSAVMSCMLPTATLRCACYAVFILPDITALLLLAGCISSQVARRGTAMPRPMVSARWRIVLATQPWYSWQ
ncbi:MAG: hypothetical protein D4R79_08580 [Comamonadaceae bacterium]|nr:MAG: hypothetical protein D4R79_08580 [Comamonadaceae bacterium]